MTEEEKKEFEEFLQWKAEKKKREEEEAERQAKLAAQESIAAEQARVETDIINTPEANEWEMRKVNLINLYKRHIWFMYYYTYCFNSYSREYRPYT